MNPGTRFRKNRWRIVVIFRHDAHPATFDFYWYADYHEKLQEIARDMDRRKPDEIRYAFACGGELEHRDGQTLFHNWHQVMTGFATFPQHFAGYRDEKPAGASRRPRGDPVDNLEIMPFDSGHGVPGPTGFRGIPPSKMKTKN